MTRAVPMVLAILAVGCGSQLRQRAHTVQETTDRARAQGAYKCAPRELAMAQSHVGFARAELDAGDYWTALDEVEVADDNARLALSKSPNTTCAAIPPVRDSDGDGLLDPVDKCPNEPEDKDGFQDDDGCPDLDNDADGIPDKTDKCPNEPEDKDNFEDDDGCPDPDNDKDGVADADDKCPIEPGPRENAGCPDTDKDGDGVVDRLDKCPEIVGDKDNDGCPRQKYIVVTREKIELKQKVHFATNKSLIMPDSFAMLNEIAAVLKSRPEIRVRIEGHTDSRGGMKHNMTLSQARADSVKQYLVGQNVPPDHMEARGFGPTQPIEDNRTEKGREQNRRVEFIITAQ